MQNTFKMVENVLLNPNIKASDIAVFFSLFSRMGTKGYCYPSVDTIAQETGYSRRTVQLSTKRLEKEGYISKIYRKSRGKQYSNYYCLQAREFENTTNTKDADLREEICQDKNFLNFINKYSMEIDANFKLAALIFVERKLNIDKREITFLMYSILMADKEAFMYFTIDRLAKRLSMATSRVEEILSSLARQGLINLLRKNRKGKEICLIRINIELLNNNAVIRKKLCAVISAKKQAKSAFSVFMTISTNEIQKVVKLTVIVFFNHWLSVLYMTAMSVIDEQMIVRQNLF